MGALSEVPDKYMYLLLIHASTFVIHQGRIAAGDSKINSFDMSTARERVRCM